MQSAEGRFQRPALDLLHQRIISSIFRALIEGRLRPGERLVEEAIAKELGVSRTPVRRALEEMSRQGVLLMIPRRGVWVADWTVEDVADLARLRSVLEGLAAELAASRIADAELERLSALADDILKSIGRGDHEKANESDLGFHQLLVRSSRNSGLISAYASLLLRIRVLMILEKQVYPSNTSYGTAAENHKAIADALRARDPVLSRKLVEENLLQAGSDLVEWLRDRSRPSEATSVPQIIVIEPQALK